MINSMTGYGKAQQLVDGNDISVEIRSVNHRFFEFSARLPRSMGYMEEKLKGFVYSRVSRGKIELNLSVIALEELSVNVHLNRPLAEGYLRALRSLGDSLGLEDDLTLSSLARFHDIFLLRKSEMDEDAVWDAVKTVAERAMDSFMEMRAVEGKKLGQDIVDRLRLIESLVGQVEERYPGIVEDYRARLLQRLSDVLENRQIDEQRILTEAAIFAEKTAVAEETVRLRSHIAQLEDILSSGKPAGRKLDFLVQEMNREINTIGSKAQDIQVAKVVVEIKGEIEKIREQVQNIE